MVPAQESVTTDGGCGIIVATTVEQGSLGVILNGRPLRDEVGSLVGNAVVSQDQVLRLRETALDEKRVSIPVGGDLFRGRSGDHRSQKNR